MGNSSSDCTQKKNSRNQSNGSQKPKENKAKVTQKIQKKIKISRSIPNKQFGIILMNQTNQRKQQQQQQIQENQVLQQKQQQTENIQILPQKIISQSRSLANSIGMLKSDQKIVDMSQCLLELAQKQYDEYQREKTEKEKEQNAITILKISQLIDTMNKYSIKIEIDIDQENEKILLNGNADVLNHFEQDLRQVLDGTYSQNLFQELLQNNPYEQQFELEDDLLNQFMFVDYQQTNNINNSNSQQNNFY